MSETSPEHSPAAEAAAVAVEQAETDQAVAETAVTAAMDASEAQAQAETAEVVAEIAAEQASDAQDTAEAAGEGVQAVAEAVTDTAETVIAHDGEIGYLREAVAGMHDKLDSLLNRIPERDPEPEVTEVHVGNSESETRTDPPATPGTGSSGTTKRHRWGH